MKKISLHISEDIRGATAYGGGIKPVVVTFGPSNQNESLLIASVNSPQGFSMSSAQTAAVLNVLSDAYEYILGSPTFSVSGTNTALTAMLSESERVAQVIQYKVD